MFPSRTDENLLNDCVCIADTESHRSDTNLKDVFESLFPGQIEHAEMLIDTSKLERILLKRQTMIEKYDSIDAKYRYNRYVRKKRAGGSEPVRPMVSLSTRNFPPFSLIWPQSSMPTVPFQLG